MNRANNGTKLKVLCLHSFRTSASIFKEQMRRSGLDRKLEDIVEFVYIDAPHEATGPPTPDVAPFFEGPYREWWAVNEHPETGKVYFKGGDETISYIERTLNEKGPFDGFWAFSQGTILTAMLLMLHRGGSLSGLKKSQFAVLFGGVFKDDYQENHPISADLNALVSDGPLAVPSVHIIGERDPVRKLSLKLAEQFKDPIILMHPRGHNIPNLDEAQFKQLREFLEFMLPPAVPQNKSAL